MGLSNSPSENYLFLNVMVNFVIVNQKLTGSALHIEKNQTIQTACTDRFVSDLFGNHIVGFPTRRLNYVLWSDDGPVPRCELCASHLVTRGRI